MTDLHTAIDTLINEHLNRLFPAASVCILHQGETLVHRAWGVIDPETRQRPATETTLFDLASLTKLFVVSAFLSLVSEGVVTLETPLAAVIPEFAALNPRRMDGGIDPFSKAPLPFEDTGATANPQAVTFWHVLTHTSGLAAWRDVYNAAGDPPPPPEQMDASQRAARMERGLAAIYAAPFVSQPGERVRYSDIGLILLGEALARLSGLTLAKAVKARVLAPLGLSDVTYCPLEAGYSRDRIAPTEDDPAWRGRRAWGEVHDENACGLGGVAGHAGLFGTAHNVAAFGEAWRTQNARLNIAPALMSQATSEQAVTGNERRGLGWMLRSLQGSSAGDVLHPSTYGHTGFTGNSLFIDPTRGLVAVILTNYVYYGREIEGIYEFRRAFHNTLGAFITP